MRTADKGIKTSAILLTKVLILVTNMGRPKVSLSCTVAAVDIEKMKLNNDGDRQVQNLRSDGTTDYLREEEYAIKAGFQILTDSMVPSASKFFMHL